MEIGRPAIEKLQNAEFSDNQARTFANNYNIIDQFNDSATGLSATVFSEVGKNTFLAVRGTKPSDTREQDG